VECDPSVTLDKVTFPLLKALGGDQRMIYLKRDGSINYGFEIVSHPMSLLYIQQNKIFETIDSFKNVLKSYRTTTCGFHVHMSKEDFTPHHLYKFQQFQYKHHTLRRRVGQRNDNHYAEVGDQYKGATRSKELAKRSASSHRNYKHGNGGVGGNRYEIINLRPSKTVEMRYFKGNLRADRLYKNIEWLTAVYWFTKDTPESQLTVKNFREYLEQNKKYYPNLYTFLSDRATATITADLEAPDIDSQGILQPTFKALERLTKRVAKLNTEVVLT
jgi:hypothetical protein